MNKEGGLAGLLWGGKKGKEKKFFHPQLQEGSAPFKAILA